MSGRLSHRALWLLPLALTACLAADDDAAPDDVAEADAAVTTTYSAAADFASTQGYHRWSYGYGSPTAPTLMTWFADASQPGGGYWKGNETYLIVGRDVMHPGAGSDAIRIWTAPEVGTVRITGTISDANPACGDGVKVTILRDGALLWSATLANAGAPRAYDLRASVVTGTKLAFVVNRNGNDWCDSTVLAPTIVQ